MQYLHSYYFSSLCCSSYEIHEICLSNDWYEINENSSSNQTFDLDTEPKLVLIEEPRKKQLAFI